MSAEIILVKAWSGKTHLFEKELPSAAAEPVSYYNRVAKPERECALTTCGEHIMVRSVMAAPIVTKGWLRLTRRTLCRKCLPIIQSRSETP